MVVQRKAEIRARTLEGSTHLFETTIEVHDNVTPVVLVWHSRTFLFHHVIQEHEYDGKKTDWLEYQECTSYYVSTAIQPKEAP